MSNKKNATAVTVANKDLPKDNLSQIRINYEDFNAYLRKSGWTQILLAKELGVSNSTISKYVSTGTPMPGRLILGIAERIGMTGEEVCICLLGGRV